MNLPKHLGVVGVHTVSGISAAVDVPTVKGISDVAGLPYAVYVCDVPIVSTAV
jgi:hypothetical protein